MRGLRYFVMRLHHSLTPPRSRHSLPIFSFRVLMPPASAPPPGTDSLGICGPLGGEVSQGGALFVHHNLVAGALSAWYLL
jgi:hypothetical protein